MSKAMNSLPPEQTMSLDDTSLAIGKLQAEVEGLKKRTESMDSKLDRLLARTDRMSLKLKHWLLLLAGGSLGGGGVAHALRKLLE
jgi:hypothetical protein